MPTLDLTRQELEMILSWAGATESEWGSFTDPAEIALVAKLDEALVGGTTKEAQSASDGGR